MHVGKAIKSEFAKQGKKKCDFAERYGKSNDLISVHQKKQHMNTYLIGQYAEFFGYSLLELLTIANGFS